MGKTSTTLEEKGEEAVPDHLRCSRTDGRQWRCRRRAMENVKLCEIHYLQGRHRQNKEKVPESLKLQRKRKKGQNQNDVVEIRARKRKKKKQKQKQGDMQLELIRMVLQREVEKNKKKKMMMNMKEELHYSEGELRKELPNGVMAIAPASTPHDYTNVGFHCNDTAVTPRYFRSKNVERVPDGNRQVVPYGRNLKKGRRRKCHWCRRSDSWNLIKCSSCQKEFFCMDCIKERLELIILI